MLRAVGLSRLGVAGRGGARHRAGASAGSAAGAAWGFMAKRAAGAGAGRGTAAAAAAASPKKRAKFVAPKGPMERGSTPRGEPPAGRGGAPQLKVVAWNLAGLRAALKPEKAEVLRRVVEAERPDILCISEHKLQAQHVPDVEKALAELLPGYSAHWAISTAKKGYAGVTALVRSGAGSSGGGAVATAAKKQDFFKPASQKAAAVGGAAVPSGLRPTRVTIGVGAGLPASAAHAAWYNEEGRCLTLELPELFVVTSYVPNAGDGLKRLDLRIGEWEAAMNDYLAALDALKPVVYIGDLNVAHQDRDIWNCGAPHVPKSAGTSPEERAAFPRLLERGFSDSFRHFHPEADGCFTYWSQRANNRPVNKGLRIDYAVVSKRLLPGEAPASGPKIFDAFHLDRECVGLSDHCAVGVTLALDGE